MYRFFGIAVLILCFTACTLGPCYLGPGDDVPDCWKGCEPGCEEVACTDYWWEVFNDPCLNALECQAIENSPNVYVAYERVIETRAMAGASRADLYPELDLAPSYSDTGMLFKIFVPGNFPVLQGNKAIFRIVQFQYILPFNLSYELDLWGKIRGQYESACMTVKAQEEAYHTTLLSLTTDLASSYFQLRALDTQIDLLERTIELRKKELELTQSRFDKGLTGYLDVTSAEGAVTNYEAQYFDTVRQRRLQENTIAVLIGESASDFCLPPNPLEGCPPPIPVGLPSEVLLQRPDIAQAERTMAAQHRLIGVAYASFFPSLDLTGTLGYLSPTFEDFLKWDSRLWSMGANAAQPLFDAGKRCSNLEATWARFREASGTYQQQVLVAFREVEDALNNLQMQSEQAGSLDAYVRASSRAAGISRSRYEKGLGNYLLVIENDSAEYDARRSQAQLLGVQYLSTVQLIKALGGCWSVDEE